MSIILSAAISFASVGLIIYFVIKFAMDAIHDSKKKPVKH
jgi:hypothetical protein